MTLADAFSEVADSSYCVVADVSCVLSFVYGCN